MEQNLTSIAHAEKLTFFRHGEDNYFNINFNQVSATLQIILN